MSSPLIPIDLTKSPKDQVLSLHNRRHCGHSQCLLYTASTDGDLHFRYSALSHWPYHHAARCGGQYDVKRPEISCLLEPIAMRSHVQTEGLFMLVYEFLCATCGSFEQRRSLQDAGEPMACPICQIVATRIYSTAGLILTSGTVCRRIERSAEPRVVKRLSPAESSPALLQRSGRTRPWQLGYASYTGTAPPGLQRL